MSFVLGARTKFESGKGLLSLPQPRTLRPVGEAPYVVSETSTYNTSLPGWKAFDSIPGISGQPGWASAHVYDPIANRYEGSQSTTVSGTHIIYTEINCKATVYINGAVFAAPITPLSLSLIVPKLKKPAQALTALHFCVATYNGPLRSALLLSALSALAASAFSRPPLALPSTPLFPPPSFSWASVLIPLPSPSASGLSLSQRRRRAPLPLRLLIAPAMPKPAT
eukprot:scaffold18354_cov134-Isochrysis_galbana.AAC.5